MPHRLIDALINTALTTLLAFTAMLIAAPAAAQPFPSKVIRLIVVYPPGGTSDGVARPLAEKLSAQLGHLMLEPIKLAAGVDIIHVPYKGGGQVVSDAAGGQFELFTSNPSPAVNNLIALGRLRVIAVAAPQRLPTMAGVPTILELVYPDSNLTSQFGVFAPARTPEAVIARLNAEINKAVSAPDMSERLVKLDNVPSPASVEQFAKAVRAEYEANARIVAKARIRVD